MRIKIRTPKIMSVPTVMEEYASIQLETVRPNMPGFGVKIKIPAMIRRYFVTVPKLSFLLRVFFQRSIKRASGKRRTTNWALRLNPKSRTTAQ